MASSLNVRRDYRLTQKEETGPLKHEYGHGVLKRAGINDHRSDPRAEIMMRANGIMSQFLGLVESEIVVGDRLRET